MIPTDVQSLLTRLSAKNDPDCDRAVELIDKLYNESRKKNNTVTRLSCINNFQKAEELVEGIGAEVGPIGVNSDEYGWYISVGVFNLTPIMKISELLIDDCRVLLYDCS